LDYHVILDMGFIACREVTGQDCQWYATGTMFSYPDWYPMADISSMKICGDNLSDSKEEALSDLQAVIEGKGSRIYCATMTPIDNNVEVEKLSRWDYTLKQLGL